MADYPHTNAAPWEQHQAELKTLVISDGITSIGKYAFSCCDFTGINIPNSVTEIGIEAFCVLQRFDR